MFYGNGKPNYFLFTDNQAAEHIATQPNMNDHSRSIDIRHHAIRKDYVSGEMTIGGVCTQENTGDILTKNLQPPLHIKHTRELNITHTKQTLTNCVTKLTLNLGRTRDDQNTPRNRRLPQHQQLPLSPSLQTDRPPIMTTHTDDHPHIRRQCPTTQRSQPPKDSVHTFHDVPRGTIKNANLAPSRKSPIMERSSVEAIMRVMVDLHIKHREKRSIPTHTKCPRHS
jgi:hypothetical protein